MFNFLFKKRHHFFTPLEEKEIVAAIKFAEKQTNGELRIYVESRCPYMDALDRAVQVFDKLKMYHTQQRNAVLIYLAMKDKQMAIFGDENIHLKLGNEYWEKLLVELKQNFINNNTTKGIVEVVKKIGEALHHHFPYDGTTDKNELPDEIVFGK